MGAFFLWLSRIVDSRVAGERWALIGCAAWVERAAANERARPSATICAVRIASSRRCPGPAKTRHSPAHRIERKESEREGPLSQLDTHTRPARQN